MVTNLRIDDWQALHRRLRGIAKRRAILDAEEAQCLREADKLKLWRRLGYIHMGEYLERELGYGPQVGGERMRVARELAELPLIEASLGDGALPYSAVRELTRIATAATEAEWLDAARGKNLRQIEALVSGRKRGDRPRDPTNPDLVPRVVRLELSPPVFALFRQVQSALADELGGRLDDSSLVELLCRRALDGGGSSERPAHQIAITVCESCNRGWQNGAGREIEVGPEVVERARCDAELIGSLEDAQPARVTATVTPRLRRQVLARDHHACTVPGCRSARNLELHHVEYQRDGGRHEIWNLTTTCTGHHQQLHEGALTIRGKAPDALEFSWRKPPSGHVGPRGAGAVDREAHDAPTAAGDQAQEARTAVERARPHVEAATKVDREAHGAPTAAGDQAQEARTAVERARPHVEAATKVDREAHGAPTAAGDQAQEARTAVERARTHAEAATKVDREAHGAPTAAGDQTQEARTAVERARARVGTEVTLDRAAHEAPTAAGNGAQDARTAVGRARRHVAAATTLDREAREALTTSGYRAREARSAVERARARVGIETTLEHLIREALRQCAVAGGA